MGERAPRCSKSSKKRLPLVRTPPNLRNQPTAHKQHNHGRSHQAQRSRALETLARNGVQERARDHAAEKPRRRDQKLQIMDVTASAHHRRKHSRREQPTTQKKNRLKLPACAPISTNFRGASTNETDRSGGKRGPLP